MKNNLVHYYSQMRLFVTATEMRLAAFKSLSFHLAVIILFLILKGVGPLFLPSTPKFDLKVIQSAVRVDVVGMPKFTVKELKSMKAAPPTPVAKGEDKPEEKVIEKVEEKVAAKEEAPAKAESKGEDFLKKDKKSKVNLSNLLSNISQKAVAGTPVKKTKRGSKTGVDSSAAKELKGLIIEGNKLSQGASLVGGDSSANATAIQFYGEKLISEVRSYWKLPSYLLEKKLQCRVQLFLSERGELLRTEIIQSSGNQEYDSRAVKAIEQAAPFPVPSSDVVRSVVRGEIALGFPL